ncbi:MAG TPA: hypothetical protein VLI39_02940 [Sedimentisphaerales bacterium]|nr:hypothetical protein [Sedimentisphaerales bacterium]
MEIETEVELTESSWLAARVIDPPDLKNRILPRDLSVFARTSPIYFLQDGKKVREQPSIDYLTKYIQGTLHGLDSKPRVHTEQDTAEAHRAAEQAMEVPREI